MTEEAVSSIRYAELHCHSNFSFLDGASDPEELVQEAAHLGLQGLALTDHDGLYGVVRFAEAASEVGLPTVFGSELSLGLSRPQSGIPDPEGRHLLVLARDPEGYARLSRAISNAQLRGKQKGRPIVFFDELAELHSGGWAVLTGCRKGIVPSAVARDDVEMARRELERLASAFGRDNVFVELWDHGNPLDGDRNDALADLAKSCRVDTVVTNNVHYATPSRSRLANAVAAIRSHRSLSAIDGWLPAASTAHLRSPFEQAARFKRFPGAVQRAAELAEACAFDLELIAPNLPGCDVPEGHTDATWLRHLTYEGAVERYGPRHAERVDGAYRQIDHELQLIEQLGFPGYFLIVRDIVDFCRRHDIYCQGRGSAANSAVCYALGITNADAVRLNLLFERFLAPDRDGPPDIDLDIESTRRELVIQYVYQRYGRERAAQVCNVVTYRARSAVRDVAKAFGYDLDQQNAWSKQLDRWGSVTEVDANLPQHVIELASQLQNAPRHLGIHSGGMVLCDRPVVEVCPVEWARKEGRTVLQWDKDDCAAAGLVKFDLLGLGMLSVLHYAVDLIRDHHGVAIDLAQLPQEDEVYDMLCRADVVGVFQVESRAQMATLPRLKPRNFYDLVIEVAIIRPGPIQGGSVNPYIRRRNGKEEERYSHPLLVPALRRTKGVPLFQEQLMRIVVDVAGFTPGEADQLRQAMGSKRSLERMEKLKGRLYEGMAEKGVTGAVADEIFEKLRAFSSFGFPESHAVSFAHLVYSSAWIKYHYPACFLAALLKGQPMGFWSPQTLSADARRHGVVIQGPDINASDATTKVEADGSVRVGLDYVRGIGADRASKIASGRPYLNMEDVSSRCELSQSQLEALATAGAFGCFGVSRRSAMWSAGAVAQSKPGRLRGIVTGVKAPSLRDMTVAEQTGADIWAIGFSPDHSPTEFARDHLRELGVTRIDELASIDVRRRVKVGGVVTHRQRPPTAGGITFLNLEDETGMLNVICSKAVWSRHRTVALTSVGLLIEGRLERAEGVINLIAEKLSMLPVKVSSGLKSRDFH